MIYINIQGVFILLREKKSTNHKVLGKVYVIGRSDIIYKLLSTWLFQSDFDSPTTVGSQKENLK